MIDKKIISTKALVGASLLTAISIILTRVLSVIVPLAGLPALRIGFGEIPIILSGIIYGPFLGGLTGGIADLIGAMINLHGAPFFPGFTLSSILWGTIPGILFILIKNNKFKVNFNIVNGIVLLIISIGIVFVLFESDVLSMKNGIYYFYEKPLPIIYAIIYVLVVMSFITIPFIITRKGKAENELYTIDKIAFIVTVSYVILSIGLNTLWLSIMFEKGFIAFLPGRILAGLVQIPLYTTIIYTLSKSFKYMRIN